MVTEMSSTYYVVMAVVQHELLFFVGLLLMFDVQRHSYRDIWVPIVGTVAIVGFSLLVYYHYIYPDFIDVEKIVIIKIIKGTIIGYVIGEENLTPAIQVVTSIGVAVLVIAVMMLFLWLNNKMFDKAERLAAERGTTLPTNDDSTTRCSTRRSGSPPKGERRFRRTTISASSLGSRRLLQNARRKSRAYRNDLALIGLHLERSAPFGAPFHRGGGGTFGRTFISQKRKNSIFAKRLFAHCHHRRQKHQAV